MNAETPDPFRKFNNVLMVELDIPAIAGIGFPVNNFVATNLLAALIKANLDRAGLDDTGGGLAQLNRSLYLFWLIDPPAVVANVRETLRSVYLEKFARLYVYDGDERIFRCIYPECGDMISYSEFLGRFTERGKEALDHQNNAAEIIASAFGIPKPTWPPTH